MTNSNKAIIEVKELDARFDSRKSFYGKAHTIRMTDGALALQSYDTIVAVIRDGKLKVRGKYSQTTSRHVREFARQYMNSFHDEDLKKYDDDPVFQ